MPSPGEGDCAVQRPTIRQRLFPPADFIPLSRRDIEHQQRMRLGTVNIDAKVEGLQRIVLTNGYEIIDFKKTNFPFRCTTREGNTQSGFLDRCSDVGRHTTGPYPLD